MNMMIQFPVMRTDVTINVALEGRASYELGMGYLISCDINETTDTVALGLVNNHNFIFSLPIILVLNAGRIGADSARLVKLSKFLMYLVQTRTNLSSYQ
jgi:hypothetical protein